MLRAVLHLLILLPLLTPTGFCPCQFEHEHAACNSDHEGDTGDDHDPNCPCRNVDQGIRGFADRGIDEIASPADSALALAVEPIIFQEPAKSASRVYIPIFTTPPRFVLYLSLLI